MLDRPACALGHDLGVAAVELHADGLVEIVGGGKIEAGRCAPEKALRAEQIRAGEADSDADTTRVRGPFADDGSECEIAIAGDRREEQVAREAQGAELERSGDQMDSPNFTRNGPATRRTRSAAAKASSASIFVADTPG